MKARRESLPVLTSAIRPRSACSSMVKTPQNSCPVLVRQAAHLAQAGPAGLRLGEQVVAGWSTWDGRRDGATFVEGAQGAQRVAMGRTRSTIPDQSGQWRRSQ